MACQKVYKQGRNDSIKANVNIKAMPHPYIFFTLQLTACLKPKPTPIHGVNNAVNEHQLLEFYKYYSTYSMTSPAAHFSSVSRLYIKVALYTILNANNGSTNSMSAPKATWSLHAHIHHIPHAARLHCSLDPTPFLPVWSPEPRPCGRRKVACYALQELPVRLW